MVDDKIQKRRFLKRHKAFSNYLRKNKINPEFIPFSELKTDFRAILNKHIQVKKLEMA